MEKVNLPWWGHLIIWPSALILSLLQPMGLLLFPVILAISYLCAKVSYCFGRDMHDQGFFEIILGSVFWVMGLLMVYTVWVRLKHDKWNMDD